MPINAIVPSGISSVGSVNGTNTLRPAADTGFADMLEKLVGNVQSTNAEANTAVTKMLNGTGEVHEAMIALHEAEESLEITVAIRNKFVQAYQEIMRMNI